MEIQNEVNVPEEIVMNKIYCIRGQKVMLDKNLAELYGVETKHLKRQVKRNRERFPEDFMFELTAEEYNSLRSQIGTLKRGEHSKFLPYVFSEHGILMLSSVLGSPQAVAVNIRIMRIFTRIRQALMDTTELRLAMEELRKKTEKNSESIDTIFQCLDQLLNKREPNSGREKIGYKI
jgi:hypothetical protein